MPRRRNRNRTAREKFSILKDVDSFFSHWWDSYGGEDITTNDVLELAFEDKGFQTYCKRNNLNQHKAKLRLSSALASVSKSEDNIRDIGFLLSHKKRETRSKLAKYNLSRINGSEGRDSKVFIRVKNEPTPKREDNEKLENTNGESKERGYREVVRPGGQTVNIYPPNKNVKVEEEKAEVEPPFGWRPCEEEIEILKKIKSMYDLGFGLKAIASALNADELFRRGKYWYSEHIKKELNQISLNVNHNVKGNFISRLDIDENRFVLSRDGVYFVLSNSENNSTERFMGLCTIPTNLPLPVRVWVAASIVSYKDESELEAFGKIDNFLNDIYY